MKNNRYPIKYLNSNTIIYCTKYAHCVFHKYNYVSRMISCTQIYN